MYCSFYYGSTDGGRHLVDQARCRLYLVPGKPRHPTLRCWSAARSCTPASRVPHVCPESRRRWPRGPGQGKGSCGLHSLTVVEKWTSMAAGLGHDLAPAMQKALTTYAYAGGGLTLTTFPAVLRARGVGGWRERRGADAGCAGTTRREGMRTEAKGEAPLFYPSRISQRYRQHAWPLSVSTRPRPPCPYLHAPCVRACPEPWYESFGRH